MAKVQALTVKIRDTFGKLRNRRLRNDGHVPAVLYGHKQDVVAMSVACDELESIVRHGNRFVQLTGDVKDQAFIKEVQWNTWGTQILHVDFARVSATEKLKVTVPVELRGEAPGTKDGGVVKHFLHNIELVCEAAAVPEKVEVNINHLEFKKSILVKDLELPVGALALAEENTIVVSCVLPTEVAESEEATGDEEPEVIGRKKTDDDDAE